MCGIAGYYSIKQIFAFDELKLMAAAITHRGPDAADFFSSSHCGLAHQRLKIIDFSNEANQPMKSHSGRYVMVFDGEVYNYNDLRREFQIPARTTSTAEIILELCEQLGVEHAISLCNGMFAIALYDTQTNTLTLIRDRMGIKPLFYYWDGEHLAFASEIKSLLKLSYIQKNKQLHAHAISTFLHLGYTGTEHTIYTNIFKLPAGSYLTIHEKTIKITSYWNILEKIKPTCITNFIEARETLRDLLEQSVRYRLQSDVDFGCFLSGGIDSSLVAAIAQRNSSSRLKTFTIGFEHAKHDERTYAKSIADFLGTDHHELIVTEKDARMLVEKLLTVYDEPYADSSAIPTMLASELASRSVSMVLSGDGGDELFMGYGAYSWAERLHNPFWQMLHTLVAQLLKYGNNRHKRAAAVFQYPSKNHIPSHISSQEQGYFSRREIQSILRFPTPIIVDEYPQQLPRVLTPAENQALFDMRYYVCEDILTKIDRASMHYSIESRVPLLDYSIVEFALNVSPQLKQHQDISKYVLKQVLYEYIPAELFNRPKWGFSIPLDMWLLGDFQYLIHDYLSQQKIEKHGVFVWNEVQKLIYRFLHKGHHYLYNRIWLLITMQRFLEKQ